ncbi:hypothetical protein RDABS01_004374 [Bienertia sinuspersici]
MFRRTFVKVHDLLTSVTHQARGFSQKSVPSQVSKYFSQAKLIDSIRLNLRYESPDSLLSLLEDPNLDSFVVANALRCAPSPETALSFVEVLKRLRKLVDSINAGEFPKVKPISFMDQMRWYATARDIDSVLHVWEELRAQAVQTFQRIMEEGAIPNSRTFTIVIKHLVNSGKVEVAKEVFYILPRMRVKRTLRQYSLLMESFSSSQQLEAMKSLVGEMKMEGVLPPRSMLPSLQRMCEAGVLEESDDFVKEMVPDNRIPNIKLRIDLNNDDEEEDGDDCSSEADTDTVQLKSWLDPSALAKALQHWRDVDICALEDAKLVWTSRLVCKMVRHFKSPPTAWQFFLWVANQPGFVHDIHTYSGMITKVARSGRVDLADDILLKLKSEGIELKISTIRQIIDFYGLFREGDAALRVFHDVNKLCGEVPKFDMVLLYSSLVRTLLKCGRDHDTINSVKEMFSLGFYPDAQTFSGLIHHFAVRGDFKTVQTLFGMVKQCGVEPDAYMYKTLVRAYCKHGRATLALRLFEDMRNTGLAPDKTYEERNDILPLPSTGQMFNVSSADLRNVHDLYSGSF